MYHSATNTPAMARTSNLNEELGMVSVYSQTVKERFLNYHLSSDFSKSRFLNRLSISVIGAHL